MENNSYIKRKKYVMNKNYSTLVSSFNSMMKRNNKHSYELDKNEELPNSVGTSCTIAGSQFRKKTNRKNGSYISLLLNKNYSSNNYNNPNKRSQVRSLKENCFKKIIINKAPNFHSNKMEISKIIRKKKLEKLYDYDHFYNNNMKTNQHMIYSKSNSKNQKDKEINEKLNNEYSKITKMKDYNVKNIFANWTRYKKRNVSQTDSINNINKRNIIRNINNISIKSKKKDTITAYDSEQKKEEKDYLGSTGNINYNSVLMTLLPLIPRSRKYKNKNFNITQNLEITEGNEDLKLYNFSTQKLGNYIIETIDQKKKTTNQFAALEKKMVKLKYFQKIHKKNLENIEMSEKFNINKKINLLLKINKKFNNIWSDYRQKINFYLHFLFDKKNDMETDLGLLYRTKKLNEKAIEKLMIQTVKKQKELEDLVQFRNFLLQVKLRMKEQPAYFNSLLLRDSRKIELGNILLTSTVGTKNSLVIKFLDSLSILNLIQLYEIHPTNNNLIRLFRKKMHTKKMIPKEFREKIIFQEDLLLNENKNNYMPKKGEKIFDNAEQFFDVLNNLENKNLYLLQRNNSIKKYTSTLIEDYENNIILIDENKDSEKKEEITHRERLLFNAKEKNKALKEQLKLVSNEEFVDNNIYTKKLIQAKANSSFVELNFFKMMNYIELLKNYKYFGVLLLEKLISIIKTFIDLQYGEYSLNRCYMFIDKLELENILKLNRKSFNEKNKYKIYDSVLQLIKLYDDIAQYVMNIQKRYEADDNNKIFMRKRREEVQTLRKIHNARETRELLENKRGRVIDKIMEKWNRPVHKAFRKVDDKNNTKIKNKFKSKSVGEIKKINKNKNVDEANGLILFE